jgi:hypothetical protein
MIFLTKLACGLVHAYRLITVIRIVFFSLFLHYSNTGPPSETEGVGGFPLVDACFTGGPLRGNIGMLNARLRFLLQKKYGYTYAYTRTNIYSHLE